MQPPRPENAAETDNVPLLCAGYNLHYAMIKNISSSNGDTSKREMENSNHHQSVGWCEIFGINERREAVMVPCYK